MTPGEQTDAALVRHKHLTLELLGLAALGANDPLEQASALIAAIGVLIERELGTAMAEPGLMAMIEPVVTAWRLDGLSERAPK